MKSRKGTEFKPNLKTPLCILNGKNLTEFGTELKKIKSLHEEKISDESKWNRIETEFENSPCILNRKSLIEFGTELKK